MTERRSKPTLSKQGAGSGNVYSSEGFIIRFCLEIFTNKICICHIKKAIMNSSPSLESILPLLASYLSTDTLKVLSSLPVWDSISSTTGNQDYWYHRTEQLVGRQLQSRIGDWRSAYYLLEKTRDMSRVTSSLIAIQVLLELGADPSADDNQAIVIASEYAQPEVVELLLKDERVDPSARKNQAIRQASITGRVDAVRLLLADSRANPAGKKNQAIIRASGSGHVDVVRLLLADPRVNPAANKNEAIILASFYGFVEVVRLLLADDRVDPSAGNNRAIISASLGRAKVVELLLEDRRVDPSASDNQLIRYASIYGYSEIVKLLLAHPRVDPTARNNESLLAASDKGHAEVVKLLLTDQRVRQALIMSHESISLETISRLGNDIDSMLALLREAIDMSSNDIAFYILYNQSIKLLIGTRIVSADLVAVGTFADEKQLEFLRAIILNNLTPYESVDWLIHHKVRQAQVAATALLESKQPEPNETVEGYYGYLLAVRYGLGVSEISEAMTGCSRAGINLARKLVAAQYPHLHIDLHLDINLPYEDSVERILGIV